MEHEEEDGEWAVSHVGREQRSDPFAEQVVNSILCANVLPLTYSSTAYVGSLTALENYFGMSKTVAILGVSLNVIGFAAGPLLWGPSSELLGRRIVYIVSGVCFTSGPRSPTRHPS